MSIDEGTWFMATGEDEGKLLIFRIREAPPDYAAKSAFPNLMAVSWRFESGVNNGLPPQDDLERMFEFEKLLVLAFAKRRRAFLTVVVTGNGVREWQWYATDEGEAMSVVNDTLGGLEPFPVQFVFQDDPEWLCYSRLLEIEPPSDDRPSGTFLDDPSI